MEAVDMTSIHLKWGVNRLALLGALLARPGHDHDVVGVLHLLLQGHVPPGREGALPLLPARGTSGKAGIDF